MNRFTVYNPTKPKIRFGKKNDGGYVIVSILEYDCFLSCGIGNDLSFEWDFCLMNPGIESHVFDGTSLFKEEDINGLEFHKLNVGAECNETFTDLKEYLEKHKDVFIKMDIEGWEYGWLDCLEEKHLINIKQITMEFHGFERSMPYIERLNKTHDIVHFHGNNYGGIIDYEGMKLPNVYEVTFLRTEEELSPNQFPLPCALDMPNNPAQNDINLNFSPFVWTH